MSMARNPTAPEASGSTVDALILSPQRSMIGGLSK